MYSGRESEVVYADQNAEEGNRGVRNNTGEIQRSMKGFDKGVESVYNHRCSDRVGRALGQ